MATVFNKKFIIANAKKENEKITKEAKSCCKLLRFSSDYNYGEILLAIMDLKPNDYPNLYFFVFEDESIENIEALQRFLIAFSKNRPMVIQVTSEDDETSKFYYKEENSETFLEVNHKTMDLNNLDSFPAFFLELMSGRNQSINDEMIEGLISHQTSSLIWRVLRSMELPGNFIEKMILKCTAKGTKDQLMNILDSSFEQKDILTSINDIKLPVLLIAVQNKNESISKFLINSCKDLVMQLPYDQQIEISTVAYETNQLEILTDLLKCDFPFPKNFDSHSVTDLQLGNIIDSREEFFAWILQGNITNIQQFIKHNSTLKNVYNALNYLALDYAFDCRRIKIFHYLKSLGFRGIKNHDFTSDVTTQKEQQAVRDSQLYQRRKNVSNAVPNERNSVLIMSKKSYIHNNTISEETEATYRQLIEKWFQDINKTKFGSKLLDAASQCNGLKLYFDFESDTVDSIDLNSPNSMGVTYRDYKRIFIGAESSAYNNREQKIKGIIIHEICHYVLGIVYENKEKPYYEGDEERIREFEEIVDEYRKYGDLEQNLDDECGGSIRTLYRQYEADLHHIELIVLAAQMQVEFDDNEEKLKHLQEEKYKLLFDYFEIFVLPDIEKFNLRKREDVRQLNQIADILLEIQELNLHISSTKTVDFLTNNQHVIVTTNFPKLLLLHAKDHLQERDKSLLNAKHLFITPQIFEQVNDIRDVLSESESENIFVDCSNFSHNCFKNIIIPCKSNFIFVVPTDVKAKEVEEILNKEDINAVAVQTNYSWTDFTQDSKDLLLQTKVSFQGSSANSLFDLIPSDDVTALDEIIDDHTLNLLIEKSQISLNSKIKDEVVDKNFPILFQPRTFQSTDVSSTKLNQTEGESSARHQNVSVTKIISCDQLIENVKDSNYVLISDIAGTGKTWALKNIADQLRCGYPTKWTTFVDLKDFIQEFKSPEIIENFTNFMIKNILKLTNNFEEKIFTKLYENGNVNILFDGYDEIAPDCVANVLSLFKSFQPNNGNQMWIATRKFFEESLTKELKLSTVYTLNKFDHEENIDMLTSLWVLHDLERKGIPYAKCDIRSSDDYENYHKIAQKLSQTILDSDTRSIGLPLLYKMMADILKDQKSTIMDISVPKVYQKFMEIQFLRWAFEKGLLRKEAIVNQEFCYALDYRQVHQLFGMKSLFPNNSTFCDLDIADCDWPKEEIIACGILHVNGNNYNFLHETYREYFAADFIIRVLMDGGMQNQRPHCKFLITFLTVPKFEVVRMFLNEALAQETVSLKVTEEMQNLSKIFFENADQLVNLSIIFDENLEYLGNFLINLFKNGLFEDFTKVLDNNKDMIKSIFKSSNMFLKLEDFMLKNLNSEELKSFVTDQKLFLKIADSPVDVETTAKFMKNIKEKTDNEFMAKSFQLQDENGEHILFHLIQSTHADINKVKQFWDILKIFIGSTQLMKMIMTTNTKGLNILHVIVGTGNKEYLDYLCREFKEIFISLNSLSQFREFLGSKTIKLRNTILHISAFSMNFDFHETLWNSLLDTFKNPEQLKELIFQKNQDEDLFTHIIYSEAPINITKFMTKILEENLSESEYKEIRELKGMMKSSLSFDRVGRTKEMKHNKFVIYCIQDVYKLFSKLIEILFNIKIDYNEPEMVKKFFQKVFKSEECRELFRDSFVFKQYCEFFDFDKHTPIETIAGSLEEIFKYEILRVLEIAKEFVGESIVNGIRNKINDLIEVKFDELLDVISNTVNNATDEKNIEQSKKKVLRLNIAESSQYGPSKLPLQSKNIISIKKGSIKSLRDLMQFVNSKSIENHKILWEYLINNFENRVELTKLIIESDVNGDNYIHLLIGFNTTHIIAFTLKTLRDNLDDSLYEAILRSKGSFGRNSLQIAAKETVSLAVFKIIWESFVDLYKLDHEFLKIMKETGEEQSNLLFEAATYGRGETFEFIIKELETFASYDQIRELLTTLCIYKQHILLTAAGNNFNICLHKILWKTMQKYFSNIEIVEFIKYQDIDGDNIFVQIIVNSTPKVLNLTWDEIKKVITNAEFGINEQDDNFKLFDMIINNIFKEKKINEIEKEMLKLNWLNIENNDQPKLFINHTELTVQERPKTKYKKYQFVFEKMIEILKFFLGVLLNMFKSQRK